VEIFERAMQRFVEQEGQTWKRGLSKLSLQAFLVSNLSLSTEGCQQR
jgi:hypothetical protein